MGTFSRKIILGLAVFSAGFTGQSYADYDNCCCEPNRFWVEADYLYWKIQNSPKPVPLVIDQPVFDGPFTTVLGDSKIDLGWRSGGKFGLGYWFDDCNTIGAEANYFFLAKESKRFAVSSDATGTPRLRVPFFNVFSGLEDSSPLATPGVFQGSALLKVDNRMQGAELNIIGAFPSCDCDSQTKFGWLAGFRWWNFDEHLRFFGNSPAIDPPSIYNYTDKFHVENNFYSGQIGASFDYTYCNFFLNLKGKVALGAMRQETEIEGSFTTDEFSGVAETFDGGFFALPTNIGHHKKTRFAVLPEIDVNIGYQFSDSLRVRVGYSVLYVSDVLWAGKQIDRNLNPTQSANLDFTSTPALVGIASPTARNKSDSLWAQGFNVGLEYRF